MEKTCSKCGSKDLVKIGFAKSGKQMYKCKQCKFRSTMIQRMNYEKADYEKLYGEVQVPVEELSSEILEEYTVIEPTVSLSDEDKRVICLYKFRIGVSEADLAKHLNKPLNLVYNYVHECESKISNGKKFLNLREPSRKARKWLGVK